MRKRTKAFSYHKRARFSKFFFLFYVRLLLLFRLKFLIKQLGHLFFSYAVKENLFRDWLFELSFEKHVAKQVTHIQNFLVLKNIFLKLQDATTS